MIKFFPPPFKTSRCVTEKNKKKDKKNWQHIFYVMNFSKGIFMCMYDNAMTVAVSLEEIPFNNNNNNNNNNKKNHQLLLLMLITFFAHPNQIVVIHNKYKEEYINIQIYYHFTFFALLKQWKKKVKNVVFYLCCRLLLSFCDSLEAKIRSIYKIKSSSIQDIPSKAIVLEEAKKKQKQETFEQFNYLSFT